MSSEFVKIECDCGYTVSVPADQFEKTEACINCGATLDKTRISTKKQEEPQPAVAQTHKATTPEKSPFEDSDGPEDFTVVPDDTREPSAFIPTPDRDVNPFEDPDEEPSPFADDAADLASEADNPKSYTDDTPKSDPSKIRKFTDAEHKNAYRGVEKEEKCPRCGNVYRGDWDKRDTIEGEMCFICSNQAVDGVPLRLQTERKKKEEAEKEGVLAPMGELRKKPQDSMEESDSFFNTNSPRFKMFVAILGFATILLTIFMISTDDFETWNERHSDEPAVVEVDETPPVELPAWVAVVLWAWNVVAALATTFLSIYLVLYIRNKLPHDDFVRNAVMIGAVTLLVVVFVTVTVLIFGIFGDPLTRIVFGTFVLFAGFMLFCFVLMNLLDFGVVDILLLALMAGLVQVFVQSISMFFKWGLASIVL
jgi:hypothetical protein